MKQRATFVIEEKNILSDIDYKTTILNVIRADSLRTHTNCSSKPTIRYIRILNHNSTHISINLPII